MNSIRSMLSSKTTKMHLRNSTSLGTKWIFATSSWRVRKQTQWGIGSSTETKDWINILSKSRNKYCSSWSSWNSKLTNNHRSKMRIPICLSGNYFKCKSTNWRFNSSNSWQQWPSKSSNNNKKWSSDKPSLNWLNSWRLLKLKRRRIYCKC